MEKKEVELKEIKDNSDFMRADGMDTLDTVITGMIQKYGMNITANILTDHFMIMLQSLIVNSKKEKAEEIMETFKQELAKSKVKIEYEVTCCPKAEQMKKQEAQNES